MKRLKPHFQGEWRNVRSRSCYCANLRYFRNIHTHQERAMYELHRKEYRHIRQLKLRARRGKALACAWHDIEVSAHYYAKSWKHNSKRHHQWYRNQSLAIERTNKNTSNAPIL